MKKMILLALCATVAVTSAQNNTSTADLKNPLPVGKPIPAGALKTADDMPFNLKEAAKEDRLAIIFYRGGWCPYCDAHLGEVQGVMEELREIGYRVIAISPDQPSKIQEHLDKASMTYTLLSDSSMKTAQAFGVAFEVNEATLNQLKSYDIDIEDASGQKHHLLPIPSVFLVGTNGVIQYVHSNPNYKVRLEPEAILAAAKAAAEK